MRRTMTRRDVLASMPAAALALSAPAFAKAKFAMPAGACDTHVHIYDTAFPYRPGLPTPPAQSGTALQYRSLVQQEMGVTRAIVVTASAYGTDNTVTLDALQKLGRNARGSAILAADISDADLKTLHDAGVRGARILPAGVPGLEALAERIAPMGWHLQISLGGPAIAELEPVLMRQPAPFVLDHCAHVPLPEGIASPVYASARRMLDGGKGWVKVSVPYDDSKIGPPDFPDFSAVARDYVRHNPERVVWGTAWPYAPSKPFLTAKAMTDILQSWAPDAKVRHRILVENPEKLYGFDSRNRPSPQFS
jgi:D-galactarolactone isomerase